jgi:hypothetical protein
VTRILVSWARLQSIESASALDRDESPRRQDWHDRRLERAQRMYVSAIKALAQVRRLALPAVQVNVAQAGGPQINRPDGERPLGQNWRRSG